MLCECTCYSNSRAATAAATACSICTCRCETHQEAHHQQVHILYAVLNGLAVIDHRRIAVKVGLVLAKVLNAIALLLCCLPILLHKQQQVSLLKRIKIKAAGPNGSCGRTLVSQLNDLLTNGNNLSTDPSTAKLPVVENTIEPGNGQQVRTAAAANSTLSG